MQLVIESAWTVKEINYRYIRTKHEGADGDKRLLASSMAMSLEPFCLVCQLEAFLMRRRPSSTFVFVPYWRRAARNSVNSKQSQKSYLKITQPI